MEVHAEEVCVKVLKELLNLALVSCGRLDPAAIHDSVRRGEGFGKVNDRLWAYLSRQRDL